MTDIQVVLFDLDGTLVDSKPGILASFSKVLEPYGVVLTPEQQRDVLGPPLKESFAQFLAQEHVEKAVKDYRAFYETTGIYQCTAYAGVEKMLADLKEDGFMLAVATCKLRKAAQFVLRHLHLEQYFDYVGGALPEGTIETKEQVIRDVLAQDCFSGKNAIMVGDRNNDMQGAEACGLPAIVVEYGYGVPDEWSAFSPVYSAQTPLDVSRWLIRKQF
ncbi:HAD hydrolase-like protein [uncultured Ruthenibacterium sp.]|uniref:HAD hydrolase-like protein n=1 Tax=uncultured Ruthenibacterium sp. TaxID=1905347 RepID=UPI00349EB5D9